MTLVERDRENRKEGRKEVAINLLDILDDEIIALKTGFSIEEVRELRKENNAVKKD